MLLLAAHCTTLGSLCCAYGRVWYAEWRGPSPVLCEFPTHIGDNRALRGGLPGGALLIRRLLLFFVGLVVSGIQEEEEEVILNVVAEHGH